MLKVLLVRQIARHVASSHTKGSGTWAPMPLQNRPFQSSSVGELQLCVGDGTVGRTCKKQACVGRTIACSFRLCKYAETHNAQKYPSMNQDRRQPHPGSVPSVLSATRTTSSTLERGVFWANLFTDC